MTDVKCDQGYDKSFVHLDGRVVMATATDLMLDSPQRRIGRNPFRRALVHDQADGLTINFANDYQGGVTLNGVREMSPRHAENNAQVKGIEADPTPILAVRGGIQFEVHSYSFAGGGLVVKTLSLHGELLGLQRRISALEARIAALEALR